MVVSDNDCILATEESQFLGVARPLLNLRGVFSGFARGGDSFDGSRYQSEGEKGKEYSHFAFYRDFESNKDQVL